MAAGRGPGVDPARLEALDRVLGRLSAAGLGEVRWFLLCDGRSGLEMDSPGLVRGPDACLFRDIDAALAAASRHGVLLTPVLFDFPWFRPRRIVHGVALGGRRRLLGPSAARARAIDRLVVPLLRRSGRDPVIAAWDVLNEPEWATLGYGGLAFSSLRPRTMRALLANLVAAVHAETTQAASVGLASARAASAWFAASQSTSPRCTGTDRRSAALPALPPHLRGQRVLLGEFPTRGSAHGVGGILRAARAAGYCGALAWSARAADAASDLEALETALGGRGNLAGIRPRRANVPRPRD